MSIPLIWLFKQIAINARGSKSTKVTDMILVRSLPTLAVVRHDTKFTVPKYVKCPKEDRSLCSSIAKLNAYNR